MLTDSLYAFICHVLSHWGVTYILVKYLKKGVFDQTSVKLSLFNQFFVTLPAAALFGTFRTAAHNVFVTFLGYCVTAEILFFVFHRLLHVPALYKYIHKRHHQWQIPMTLATLDTHPIEHLLTNVIPVLCGPALLGTNTALLCFWITVATVNSLLAHSGYSRNDFHTHHHRFVSYNYGIFGILDKLCGTKWQPTIKI